MKATLVQCPPSDAELELLSNIGDRDSSATGSALTTLMSKF